MSDCKLIKSFGRKYIEVCKPKRLEDMSLEELMQVKVVPDNTDWLNQLKSQLKEWVVPLLWRYRR